jgi:hypothetical protein
VEAQHARARVLRAEAVAHDARPQAARGAELGDLLEEVVVRVEEEAQLRRELVDVEPRGERGFDVGDAVGQREGDLLRGGAAGLADVVAADRDGVPLRHVLAHQAKMS